ncbi:MAG TPA: GNAT family N-acetyltransferase [Verrucomicrobiae bacterium]|nr:GNAT family N-acetyltransferase [Verrucomicrobiae bacterium]
MEETTIRKGTAADLDAMVTTLARAFADDPVWGGWGFPDRARALEQRRVFFGLWVEMSLRDGWLLVTGGCEAVASWFHPGAGDDTPQDAARFRALAHQHLGAGAPLFLQGCALIERNRRADEPFHFLSLLGTHDAHRGRALGGTLLDASLAIVDRDGRPAYLDSTNPANIPFYERRGFRRTGSYRLPDGPVIEPMWRRPLGAV